MRLIAINRLTALFFSNINIFAVFLKSPSFKNVKQILLTPHFWKALYLVVFEYNINWIIDITHPEHVLSWMVALRHPVLSHLSVTLTREGLPVSYPKTPETSP